MKKQQGFAALEVLLVLVVVAVLGFTAWTYYNHHQTAIAPESPTAQVQPSPQINSLADLTTAENVLNQIDIDANSSDSSQLDSQLSNF